MITILPYRFEEAWDEGCPHNLVLCGLGICKFHSYVPVIFMVQEREILLMRTLRELLSLPGNKMGTKRSSLVSKAALPPSRLVRTRSV